MTDPDRHGASPVVSPRAVAPGQRLVVGIASTGRAPILADTVADLSLQSRKPDLLVISVAEPGDLLGKVPPDLPFPAQVVAGPRGLPRQRNRILDVLRHGDLLLFIDDDFLLAPDYLAELERLFAERPDAAMFTGRVLADGVVGRGIAMAEGRATLDASAPSPRGALHPVYNGYGCNMALRADPVIAHGLRFDETLPAYAWLEDVDFSRQLAAHGAILKADALRGVHLGTKTGRTPGRKLGYSQMVNPVYLMRKGTMAPRRALRLMARNLASNLIYSVRPRPWTDSRGRLIGNLRGLWDIATGRAAPGRISEL